MLARITLKIEELAPIGIFGIDREPPLLSDERHVVLILECPCVVLTVQDVSAQTARLPNQWQQRLTVGLRRRDVEVVAQRREDIDVACQGVDLGAFGDAQPGHQHRYMGHRAIGRWALPQETVIAEELAVVGGEHEHGVTLWDSFTLKPKAKLRLITNDLRELKGAICVAFSPVGDSLVVGAENNQHGFVTVWDTRPVKRADENDKSQ